MEWYLVCLLWGIFLGIGVLIYLLKARIEKDREGIK